jgi:hypothetical protein
MQDDGINGSGAGGALASLWNVHRHAILLLGHELRERLPVGEPPITLHGRDLRPSDEGVGFQFQYLMSGPLPAAVARAAYYVVQLQLIRRTTSVAWLVDALPVLDQAGTVYRLYHKRSSTVPLHDRARLRRVVLEEIGVDGSAFFEAIRTGTPIDGPFTEITADAQATPV